MKRWKRQGRGFPTANLKNWKKKNTKVQFFNAFVAFWLLGNKFS